MATITIKRQTAAGATTRTRRFSWQMTPQRALWVLNILTWATLVLSVGATAATWWVMAAGR